MNETLIPIDYNGGEVWISNDDTIWMDDLIYNQNTGELTEANDEWTGETHTIWKKVVAQSINLKEPLPNIPYVQIEENIYQMSEDDANNWNWIDDPEDAAKENWKNGWRYGYKKASSKKYTEEDMKNCWFKAMRTFKDNQILSTQQFNNFIQSLQPKVISIEIEMNQICGANNPCECFERDIDCQVLVDEIVPYQKDGKTFLKVLKINYA